MIGLADRIGLVEVSALLADPARFGASRVQRIAGPTSAPRRGPVFVAADAVLPALRAPLGRFFATRRSEYSARSLLRLDACALAGEGSLLVPAAGQAHLLRESAAEFLNNGRVPHGLRAAPDGSFTLEAAPARHIAGPCLLLKRPWSDNFGHFLVDQAASLAWLVALGVVPAPRLVVHRASSPALRATMRTIVESLLPGAELLEHPHDELWTFDALHYLEPVHVPPLHKRPEAMASLRQAMLAHAPRSPLAAPRLYLVRPDGPRALAGEGAVRALAASFGFVAVSPERYSFPEQVALFAQARAVMGVKGAAMTNLLFAPPDCAVLLLSPGSFIDPFFWDIAGIAGMAYAEAFGPVTTDRAAPGRNDFTLDPGHVRMMLDVALAAPATENWRCCEHGA